MMAYPLGQIYMKRKWSYISSNLFIKCFTEHFFKHRASGKAIMLVDGSSLVLLQTAIENNVTIICLPNHYGDRGSTVVKVLCYKSEGSWFDPS